MADEPRPKQPTPATDRAKFGWKRGDVTVKPPQPPPPPPPPVPPSPPSKP